MSHRSHENSEHRRSRNEILESEQAWEYDVTWNPWSTDFDFPEGSGGLSQGVVTLRDDAMIEQMRSLTINGSDSDLKGNAQGISAVLRPSVGDDLPEENNIWTISGSRNEAFSAVDHNEGVTWFTNNSLTTFSNVGYQEVVNETDSTHWSINSICNIGSFGDPISRNPSPSQPGMSLTADMKLEDFLQNQEKTTRVDTNATWSGFDEEIHLSSISLLNHENGRDLAPMTSSPRLHLRRLLQPPLQHDRLSGNETEGNPLPSPLRLGHVLSGNITGFEVHPSSRPLMATMKSNVNVIPPNSDVSSDEHADADDEGHTQGYLTDFPITKPSSKQKKLKKKSKVSQMRGFHSLLDGDDDVVVPIHRPHHRDAQKVRLHECIRKHARQLLKFGFVDPETNEVHDATFVEKADAERFSKTRNPKHGPSIERFEMDLSMPRSAWNKRLSVVFADHFINSELYGYCTKDQEDVQEAFLVHLKTIRSRIVSSQGKSVIDQLDQTKASARDMRRRNLMIRRRKACEAYPFDSNLQTCLGILNSVPHSVCSGDESAHEAGDNQYAITKMEWRAPMLRNVFKILDRLYLSTRFTTDNRATRGAFPHNRIPSERLDHRAPPVGLPKNFYSIDYLQKLESFQVENLKMRPPVLIGFSPSMMRLAERFSGVTSRDTLPLPFNDPSLPRLAGDWVPLKP